LNGSTALDGEESGHLDSKHENRVLTERVGISALCEARLFRVTFLRKKDNWKVTEMTGFPVRPSHGKRRISISYEILEFLETCFGFL